jgi:tetratricopeptide (TPR) repeat protein
MIKLSRGTWLIVSILFLVPIIGGHITTQPQPLDGGLGPWLSGVLGPELPINAFALLCVPALAMLVFILWRHNVVQTPNPRYAAALFCFLALGLGSIVLSSYKSVSIEVYLTFAGSILAGMLVPIVLGRRSGPEAALTALASGTTIVALKGISEYASMRRIDPTWRVFADWINQNALAGMLILGLFASLALVVVTTRTARFAAAAATSLITITLILTQSKGGIACAAIGLLIFGALMLAWRQGRKAGWSLIPAVVGMLFVVALQSQSALGEKTAVSRLGDPSAQQEQSVGFRKQLWLSAIDLSKSYPAGIGLGSFRYLSAQPGRVQQTNLAHNTFLQLAAEASWLAPLALVAALLFWLAETLRGAKHLPDPMNSMRAAVVAGVSAFAAHNLVESSLYMPGLCLAFFLFLGIGLQLSADGSAPELVPAYARRPAAVMVLAFVLLPLAYMAFGEHLKARIHGDLMLGRPQQALDGIRFAKAVLPYDAEAFYLMGSMATETPSDLIDDLRTARNLLPTTRHNRALARGYADMGQIDSAKLAIESALKIDPNNLFALEQLLDLYRSNGRIAEAVETAKRMVDIESKDVFRVRAIPELVPTQTYRARIFLANQTKDPVEKMEMLEKAVEGFDAYRIRTAPLIMRAAKSDPPQTFAGESITDLSNAMELAKQAAVELSKLYREQGRGEEADRMETKAEQFKVDW